MSIEDKDTTHDEDPQEEDPEEEEEDEEEDLVDPLDNVREKCGDKPACQPFRAELDECTERVNSRSTTAETCTQELFDFLHCTDKCISENIFKHLK